MWHWAAASLSVVLMTGYMAWFVHLQQMDFQVYRMGGQHVLSGSIYSSAITVLGQHLLFTYPPIAAMVFWPLSHLSIRAGQAVWDAVDLVALTALIAVSIAAAQKRKLVGSDWRTALILLAPLGWFLYPVRDTLVLGQINIVLVLMLVVDLTIGVSWRERHLPTGLLVGLAAAIKLTPLVCISYLVVTRQLRAARTAVVTFVLTSGAMFAVAPRSSWTYFTNDVFDARRVGNAAAIGNQTLREALVRAHVPLSSVAFDLVAATVVCVGLVVAGGAYRRSSAMLGMLVCAATGLLLSPVSWMHHYVWIVPALIWLVAGQDAPVHGKPLALAAALVFIVIQPGAEGGSGLLWYLRDDAYVLVMVASVGLVGIRLVTLKRRDAAGDDVSGSKPLEGERTTAEVSPRRSLRRPPRKGTTPRQATLAEGQTRAGELA